VYESLREHHTARQRLSAENFVSFAMNTVSMAQVGLACDILYFSLGSTSARMEQQIDTHLSQLFDLHHVCVRDRDLSHMQRKKLAATVEVL
jgi:hypothetical protein